MNTSRVSIVLLPLLLAACGDDGFRIPGDLRVAVLDAEFGGEAATHVDGSRLLDEAHLIDSVVFDIETPITTHRVHLGSAVLRRALLGNDAVAFMDGESVPVRASWQLDPLKSGSQTVELRFGNTNTFDVIRLEVWPVDRRRTREVEVERRPDSEVPVQQEETAPPEWVWC